MKFTTQINLVPRLRMSGALPLLSLYVFVAWTGITLLLLSTLCFRTLSVAERIISLLTYE